MADVDYSIAAKVQPPKFDAMGVAGQAIQLGTGMLENRLIGQQVDSKIALGRAVTSATDPQTGEVDWNKALSSLAQDPRGSFAVPELAGEVLDRHIKQTQLDTAQLALSAQRWGLVGDWAGSTLSGQDFSKAALQKSITDNLIGSKLFTDKDSVGQLTNLYTSLSDDPEANKQALARLAQQAHFTTERIAAVYAAQHGGISPESDAEGTPVFVPGPNGTVIPSKVRKSDALSIMAGGSPIRTGAPQTAEGVPLPDAGTPAYSVQGPRGEPGVVTRAEAARAAAGGGAAPAGPRVITTGPAAGVVAAQTDAAGHAARMAQTWRDEADKAPTTLGQLDNLRDQMGRFTSGPQATWVYRLKALGTQLGITTPAVKDEVAAQEEFNKLAAQFINSQVGAIGGGGTDSKLEAAMHGSPNELLSQLGATGVVALMEGLEKAKIIKNEAWQKWLEADHTVDSAGQFDTQWNKIYNPRVFQAQYMSPAQRTNMLGRMNADERKKYLADEANARKFGWIK